MAKLKTPTQQQITDITRVLAAGNYLASAAAFVSIKPAQLEDWLDKGADELARRTRGLKARTTYQAFLDLRLGVDQALTASEVLAVERLNTMASDTRVPPHVRLKAEQFLLERRHPERWGKRVIDTTRDPGKDGHPGVPGDTASLVADIQDQTYQPGGPADLDECIGVLSGIMRGTVKSVKTNALGAIYSAPPSPAERVNAAAILHRLLKFKAGGGKPITDNDAPSIWRPDEADIH